MLHIARSTDLETLRSVLRRVKLQECYRLWYAILGVYVAMIRLRRGLSYNHIVVMIYMALWLCCIYLHLHP
jgi:hypothetical protein